LFFPPRDATVKTSQSSTMFLFFPRNRRSMEGKTVSAVVGGTCVCRRKWGSNSTAFFSCFSPTNRTSSLSVIMWFVLCSVVFSYGGEEREENSSYAYLRRVTGWTTTDAFSLQGTLPPPKSHGP
jgi:hypothetical protein